MSRIKGDVNPAGYERKGKRVTKDMPVRANITSRDGSRSALSSATPWRWGLVNWGGIEGCSNYPPAPGIPGLPGSQLPATAERRTFSESWVGPTSTKLVHALCIAHICYVRRVTPVYPAQLTTSSLSCGRRLVGILRILESCIRKPEVFRFDKSLHNTHPISTRVGWNGKEPRSHKNVVTMIDRRQDSFKLVPDSYA